MQVGVRGCVGKRQRHKRYGDSGRTHVRGLLKLCRLTRRKTDLGLCLVLGHVGLLGVNKTCRGLCLVLGDVGLLGVVKICRGLCLVLGDVGLLGVVKTCRGLCLVRGAGGPTAIDQRPVG